MANVHQIERLQAISKLMDIEEYSDLVISCQGREFKVHRAIIGPMSPVIDAACKQNFVERKTGTIEHKDYDADTVQRMVSYVYTQEYEVKDFAQEHGVRGQTEAHQVPQNVNGKLMAHARVYALGEYYQMPLLKSQAKDYFTKTAKSDFQIEGFTTLITEVNGLASRDDRGLREALRNIAQANIRTLTKDTDFMADLAELPDTQDFAADLLRQMVRDQILEKNASQQQLQGKDQEIQALNTHLGATKRELDVEKQSTASLRDAHNDYLRHTENIMRTLVDDLRNLPSQCSNARCGQEFGELSFSRKGDAQRGAGEGKWEIRCNGRGCNKSVLNKG